MIGAIIACDHAEINERRMLRARASMTAGFPGPFPFPDELRPADPNFLGFEIDHEKIVRGRRCPAGSAEVSDPPPPPAGDAR